MLGCQRICHEKMAKYLMNIDKGGTHTFFMSHVQWHNKILHTYQSWIKRSPFFNHNFPIWLKIHQKSTPTGFGFFPVSFTSMLNHTNYSISSPWYPVPNGRLIMHYQRTITHARTFTKRQSLKTHCGMPVECNQKIPTWNAQHQATVLFPVVFIFPLFNSCVSHSMYVFLMILSSCLRVASFTWKRWRSPFFSRIYRKLQRWR